MKRRWPLALAALLLVLFSISLVVALISRRQIRGSVPLAAPILSMGAIEGARLVGTTQGLFVTSNDVEWSLAGRFGRSAVFVGSSDGIAMMRSRDVGGGSKILATSDLEHFDEFSDSAPLGFGLVTLSASRSYVLEPGRVVRIVQSRVEELSLPRMPEDVSSIAVSEVGAQTTIYIGSLRSGVWLAHSGDAKWRRLVGTPTRYLLIDNDNSDRLFLGTPGGLLISEDAGGSWQFTSLREPVEALTQDLHRFYAITATRVVYRSSDGKKDWSSSALGR